MYRNSLLIINKCSISGSWCSSTAVRIPFTYHILAIFNSMHHLHSAPMCWCVVRLHVWQAFCWCVVAFVTGDNERINLHLNGRRQIKKTLHNLFSSERERECSFFLYHRHCVVFALLICNLLHVTWVIFVCRSRFFIFWFFSFWEIQTTLRCIEASSHRWCIRRPNLIALFI